MTQSKAELLANLTRTNGDPSRKVLFTGASIVTMDPNVPDLPSGDLLIEGNQIRAIGADLRGEGAATDAIVIDARGYVISPGFVDTHRHSWQAQMRRTIPDVNDLYGYVTETLARVAPAYEPDDMYVGTHLAALTAIDAGITTLLDFSHNSRTQEHSNAAIRALLDSGIRGVHSSMSPHFGDWDEQWPGDLKRLREEFFSSDDQLVTLRMAALATPDISGERLAYGPTLASIASDLDIGVSLDVVFGEGGSNALLEWEKQGLLNPRMCAIHGTALTDAAWRAMADNGVKVSLAPTSDMQIGLEDGVAPIDAALAVGIRPGLSVDVEVALVSDMFSQMRTLLYAQRSHAVNEAYGTDQTPNRIDTRDVLDFATLQGASAIGLESVTGSLTPGKQADLIMVDGEAINNMPLHDPIGTLVLGADPRNIEAVFVAGRARKWDGQLVDVDVNEVRRNVHASRDRVAARLVEPA